MKKTMLMLGAAALTAGMLTGCSWCCQKETATCPSNQPAVCPMPMSAPYGSWDVEGEPENVDANMMLTDEGKVSGCSGVNRYFGTYEFSADTGMIKFGPMGSTMMAGLPAAMDFESAFLANLGKATRYQLTNDGKMKLFDGDVLLMTLELED